MRQFPFTQIDQRPLSFPFSACCLKPGISISSIVAALVFQQAVLIVWQLFVFPLEAAADRLLPGKHRKGSYIAHDF